VYKNGAIFWPTLYKTTEPNYNAMNALKPTTDCYRYA